MLPRLLFLRAFGLAVASRRVGPTMEALTTMEDESKAEECREALRAWARNVLLGLGWTEEEIDALSYDDLLRHAQRGTPPPATFRM